MSFGDELVGRSDGIVQRWYDRWRTTTQAGAEVSEAALKDALPRQLRLIGEQLRDLATAEEPREMWKVASRLDPEERARQEFSVAEVVLEYRMAADVVRDWIEEQRIDVTFKEYSYFFAAMSELSAESVQRYAEYQAALVKKASERAAELVRQASGLQAELVRQASGLQAERVRQASGLQAERVKEASERRADDVKQASERHAEVVEQASARQAEFVEQTSERQAELVRRSRAEYLAGVMHQLRTPLATLSTQFQLLTRTGRTPDAAFLARVNRAATRLQTLVDGILRVERYTTTEQPVQPQELEAAPFVEAIMRDHEHLVPARGFVYESHVDPTLRISVDPDLFTDALGNLVHNATKFTSAGYVVVDGEVRGDRVLFRVRDSGPGIAPEKQRTIFRDVQPGSGSIGTGLGLRIANHAVLAMGGTIGVESEPGKGSTLWFDLPRNVAARK
ncbi:MAG TPA: ATP-binding protein [Myxococcales bacterium]